MLRTVDRARRLAAAGVAVVVASMAVGDIAVPPPAEAGGRYRVRSQKIGKGLRLKRILDRRGPNQIRVLELSPNSPLVLDMALARGRIPYLQKLGKMASSQGAVAGINGDFYTWTSLGAGRPVHTYAEHGLPEATELAYGRNFSTSQDRSTSYIGRPKFRSDISHPASGGSWRIHRWNDVLGEKQVAAYTQKGSWAIKPPEKACSMRLVPAAPPRWDAQGLGVAQDLAVDALKCQSSRLGRKNGTVVSAAIGSHQGTAWAKKITPGDLVKVTWSLGWEGVAQTIGGNPTLLEDGRITAQCEGSPFCKRHPRTGVGKRPNGAILLVTVDGRQKKRSVGMTPFQFARLFKWLGADWALNLDGGGSTTLWAKGKVRNQPSGGKQRPIGNGILILRPPQASQNAVRPASQEPNTNDESDPSILDVPELPRALVPGLEEPSVSTFGACAPLRDPASTGGLSDAVAKGALGGPERGLPPGLERSLRVFRGTAACHN